MAKYNIREYKESGASYQESINPDILDELHTKILNILLIQRKFMDKDYSAKKLAQDLNTNSRYVSAVCNVKFHMNYATLINKYRIDEAMSILIDRRYLKLNMEDVASMVGFANRQSFYSAFYKQNGITDSEIKTYPVSVNQDWSYTKTSDQKPEDQMYVLSQVIEVDSSSVDAISNLSKDASKLASINALYSTQSVEYYYSGLPELRINLLSDAIKDAKLRAQKIAESNNQIVGSLRSASMGSVLVLAPNANVEDGSWGSYDTSTIDKEVMVTVRASFLIK